MKDDAEVPGMPRFPRIDGNDPEEVRRWSERFGCSAEELQVALAQVGEVAEDVETFLRHRLPKRG
jgi:hypothetical protein